MSIAGFVHIFTLVFWLVQGGASHWHSAAKANTFVIQEPEGANLTYLRVGVCKTVRFQLDSEVPEGTLREC